MSHEVPAGVECALILDPSFLALDVPQEAWPTREDNGKQSYTRDGPLGIKMEVHFGRPVKQYFIKVAAAGAPGLASRTVNWKKHGGPVAAWEVAKALSGWK